MKKILVIDNRKNVNKEMYVDNADIEQSFHKQSRKEWLTQLDAALAEVRRQGNLSSASV